MGAVERRQAIAKLQKARGDAPLLTYVTSPRDGLATGVSCDIYPRIYEHLRRLVPKGKVPRIDLFVMTYGGDTNTPLMLQHMLREYAEKVSVLVPAECMSSGTMIALGADEIVMAPLGMLSPIDPNLSNPLNPQARIPQMMPNGQIGQPLVQVEVEQVFSYLSLAYEKAELKSEDAKARAFEILAQQVHPLVLGEVHRTHSLIRELARRLLSLHMTDDEAVASIVQALTEKLYSHSYRISRKDAATKLKLPVVNADEPTEAAMMGLRDLYISDAKMEHPYSQDVDDQLQAAMAAGQMPLRVESDGAYIESSKGESIFQHARIVTPGGIDPQGQQQFSGKDSWKWLMTWR